MSRILLKLSGEALAGDIRDRISTTALMRLQSLRLQNRLNRLLIKVHR
mgnify:CR=1 FL=1